MRFTAASAMAACLATVVAASNATAQSVTTSPFSLDIGGFAWFGIGYADTEATDKGRRSTGTAGTPVLDGSGNQIGVADDATGASSTNGQPVALITDAELHFNFRLTTDNGLTFGFKAELDANGSDRNMDEYVGSVRGSFGTVELGVEDGAHDRLTDFFATYDFVSVSDADGLLFDFQDSGVVVPDSAGGDTGDDFKITYFSPRVAGFQAGASYSTGSEHGTSNDETDDSGEGFEVGARYDDEFGDVSVAFGGGYTFFTDDDDDDGWTVGTVLGYAGFEVSGALGRENADKTSYSLGLSYGTGPWGSNISFAQIIEGADFKEDAFGITGEVTYALAPGVKVGIGLEYASDTFEVDGDGEIIEDGDNSDGFAAGLRVGLTF